MTTTMDETVVPVGKDIGWKPVGAGMLPAEGADSIARRHPFKKQGAEAIAPDQGLPRLLHELAVRLPAQPDIQALCVWLYEPANQAIRLHVLMADFSARFKTGMDFPVED